MDASLRSDTGCNAPVPSPEPKLPNPPSSTNPLLDRVRFAIRTGQYSYRTEKASVGWMTRLISLHTPRHPADMGEAEIGSCLSSLASNDHVSASTQNQALNALLFLDREVLGQEIGYLNSVVRTKRPQRLPVVLTREAVKGIFEHLTGREWSMAMRLYGTGLRLMECLRLRVTDIDFSRNELLIRSGKGDQDQVTMLPTAVKEPLRRHLESGPDGNTTKTYRATLVVSHDPIPESASTRLRRKPWAGAGVSSLNALSRSPIGRKEAAPSPRSCAPEGGQGSRPDGSKLQARPRPYAAPVLAHACA